MGTLLKPLPITETTKLALQTLEMSGQQLNKGRVQGMKEYLRQMDMSVSSFTYKKGHILVSFLASFVLILSFISPSDSHRQFTPLNMGEYRSTRNFCHVLLNDTSSSFSRLLDSSAHLWSSSWMVRAYLQSSSSLTIRNRRKILSHVQSRQMFDSAVEKMYRNLMALISLYSLY